MEAVEKLSGEPLPEGNTMASFPENIGCKLGQIIQPYSQPAQTILGSQVVALWLRELGNLTWTEWKCHGLESSEIEPLACC